MSSSFSSTAARLFAREFFICASLSFIIILGVLHALLHMLHLCFVSDLALRSPLARFLTAPAEQLSRIADAHTYLLIVSKVTIACTVLVFAVREIIVAGGTYLGWWRTLPDDVEAGDLATEEQGWREDKKVTRPFGWVDHFPQFQGLTRVLHVLQVSWPDNRNGRDRGIIPRACCFEHFASRGFTHPLPPLSIILPM
ncbi:hypothetical protein DFH09DRAFT_472527 [Mycena vulgaris]|nr:hypothetical protein DFH09DRAFT_472527 [Mycena vulgaris]